MKIAVISSYAWIKDHNNYGALLQYYALQTYLHRRGHEVYWIRYVLKGNIKSTIKNRLRQIKNPSHWLREFLCHRSFMSFVDRYLTLSAEEYSSEDVLEFQCPLADFYITGSDQVWGGTLKANYLTFVKDNTRKIAYAASFGKDSISEEQLTTIEPWIKDFRSISVRESTGVDICRSIGVDAIHLLDPTLLLQSHEYPTIDRRRVRLGKYYFSYFLNAKSAEAIRLSEIIDFTALQQAQYKVAAIQGTESFIPPTNLVTPSPKLWMTYYRESEGVITNTFHGTVFAIIYHRPFAVILQRGESGKQNGRILSLLDMFHLMDRIWDDTTDLCTLMNKPINWNLVENERLKWVEKTDLFFSNIGL